MTEHSSPAAPALDPQLNQQQLANNRRVDVLRWDPSVTEYDLQQQPLRGVTVDLANTEPLQVVGDKALMATLIVGREKQLNIWGHCDDEGKLAVFSAVLLTDEAFDPLLLNEQGMGPGAGVEIIGNSAKTLQIGRENKALKAHFSLPDTVSRRHAGITLSDEGVLSIQDYGSSNGTRVLMKTNQNKQAEIQAPEVNPKQSNDAEVGKAAVRAMMFGEKAVDTSAEKSKETEVLNELGTSATSLLLAMHNHGDKRVRLVKNHEGKPVLTMQKGDWLVMPKPQHSDNFGNKDLRFVEITDAEALLDEAGGITGFTSVRVKVGGAERRDGWTVGSKIVFGDSDHDSSADIRIDEKGQPILQIGLIHRQGFGSQFSFRDREGPARATGMLRDIQKLVTQATKQFTGPDSLK